MPTLRPLTDVHRFDATFFVDVVVPALRAAGFDGTIALEAPGVSADVVIAAGARELDALLAGKQKTTLSALDKLKAEKHGDGDAVAVRGQVGALRALVRALAPKHAAAAAKVKDVGGTGPALGARRRDRVRRPGGGYIKGARKETAGAQPRAALSSAPTMSAAQDGRAPADRTAFALQNLAAFVDAGLRRLQSLQGTASIEDASVIVVVPGDARLEGPRG